MRCLVIGIGCWLLASTAVGQLTVSVNEDSKFVLGGTATGLLGVEFLSRDENGLIPGPGNDTGPFSFLLSNDASKITFGTLMKNLNIDGELVLPAGMKPGTPDISIKYGTIDEFRYLERTQDDPPAWMQARLFEKIVDDVPIQVKSTFRGEALEHNHIGVDYDSDSSLKKIVVGSIDWANHFSFDGSVGQFEVNGETVQLLEGEVRVPDGWGLTEFVREHADCPPPSDITIGLDPDFTPNDSEPVCTRWTELDYLITAPSTDEFAATPEPSANWLFVSTLPFAFVLRKRR